MLTDSLVYLLHLVFAHPFFYMASYMILMFGTAFITKPETKFGKWRYLFWFGFFLIFFNFLFGHAVDASLINSFGEKGLAKITDKYETSTQYNNQDVYGYHTLIKSTDGKVIETSFRSDDFNVYPNRNSVTYPHVGAEFNVRYLNHFPSAFVILTDDDSSWANEMNCASFKEKYNAAMQKYNFDRNNLKYREACISAIKEIISHKCYTDSADLQLYKGDLEYVSKGKEFPKN